MDPDVVCASFSYKPGAALTWRPVGECIEFVVSIDTFDCYPIEGNPETVGIARTFIVRPDQSEAEVKHLIYMNVLALELHEIDEFLRFDGVCLNKPTHPGRPED